jgi:hypothetical protein
MLKRRISDGLIQRSLIRRERTRLLRGLCVCQADCGCGVGVLRATRISIAMATNTAT